MLNSENLSLLAFILLGTEKPSVYVSHTTLLQVMHVLLEPLGRLRAQLWACFRAVGGLNFEGAVAASVQSHGIGFRSGQRTLGFSCRPLSAVVQDLRFWTRRCELVAQPESELQNFFSHSPFAFGMDF